MFFDVAQILNCNVGKLFNAEIMKRGRFEPTTFHPQRHVQRHRVVAMRIQPSQDIRGDFDSALLP